MLKNFIKKHRVIFVCLIGILLVFLFLKMNVAHIKFDEKEVRRINIHIFYTDGKVYDFKTENKEKIKEVVKYLNNVNYYFMDKPYATDPSVMELTDWINLGIGNDKGSDSIDIYENEIALHGNHSYYISPLFFLKLEHFCKKLEK
jgi:hypothetical protein